MCGENSTFSRQQFQEFDYEKFTQSPLSTVYLLSVISLPSYAIAMVILPDKMENIYLFVVSFRKMGGE